MARRHYKADSGGLGKKGPSGSTSPCGRMCWLARTRDRWEGGGGGTGESHLFEAKQLGAIKPSFAVGTIYSEEGAGSKAPAALFL